MAYDNNLSLVWRLQSYSDKTVAVDSKKAPKAKFQFTEELLNRIITSTMSKEEVRLTAEAYFSHKVNQETSQKDMVLQTFLDQRFSDEENQHFDRNNPPPQNQDRASEDEGSFTESVTSLDSQLYENTPSPASNEVNNQRENGLTDLSEPPSLPNKPASSQNTGNQP